MGGGGHKENTTINNVHNIQHENTQTVNNKHTSTSNQMHEDNLYTDIQDGDKVLGGQVIANNDLNTGTALYKLQNLLEHEKKKHHKSHSKGKLAILLVWAIDILQIYEIDDHPFNAKVFLTLKPLFFSIFPSRNSHFYVIL